MGRTQTTTFYLNGGQSLGFCYMNCHDNTGVWNCGDKWHDPKDYDRFPLNYPWSYTWPK